MKIEILLKTLNISPMETKSFKHYVLMPYYILQLIVVILTLLIFGDKEEEEEDEDEY